MKKLSTIALSLSLFLAAVPVLAAPAGTFTRVDETTVRASVTGGAANGHFAFLCCNAGYAACTEPTSWEDIVNLDGSGNGSDDDVFSEIYNSCHTLLGYDYIRYRMMLSGYEPDGNLDVGLTTWEVPSSSFSATLAAGYSTAFGDFSTEYGPIVITIIGIVAGLFGLKLCFALLTRYVRGKNKIIHLKRNRRGDWERQEDIKL